LALARAAWPRAPKQLWVVAIAAGVIADLDACSAWISPSTYLAWHRTYMHSVLAAVFLAALCAAAYQFAGSRDLRARFSIANAFAMALAASCLHLLLDVFGTQGAAIFWPFSSRRFVLDWAVEFDPLIMVALLAALLLPELMHLVSSEIGARDTRPRGRITARVAFVVILIYFGIRANFHGNVIALLGSRTYHGEVADKVGAFPARFSPFEWSCVVDTARSVQTLTVLEGPVESFDPESAESEFKPEPSPSLEAAQKTKAAERFLRFAQFPKATVETTPTGTIVMLRDMKAAATDDTSHELAAVIRLNKTSQVGSQTIAWATRIAEE
ncbi:MAG TPA: metal-dependent hydrolase, partial [Candidatus Dormibacteraeota bacterium]|nr:metal-dependent hydrolase [Candidatus Dormibacteraeota bacterium]